MLIGTFGVVLGFLSGIYPALVMSDFHPLQILKNSSGSLKGRVGLRKVLVTGQFIASITLIAGAAFVVEQLQFMRNYKLGYDKETTLLIDYNWSPKISEHLEAVKQELLKIPTVVAVSASFGVPGEQIPNWDSGIETQPGKITGESLNVYLVDKDFLTNYSIKIIAGRNFSRDFPADDSTAFIVNEAAVKRFGWTPEMAIGKKASQREKRGTIIGVVKDFYYRSLHHEVEPLIIQVNHYWCKKLSIKIRPGDIPGTVIAIQNKWKTLADLPFDYSFLDQDYDRLYKSESQLSKLVIVFSVLAVLIAMMGLIGLTLFTAECRVKEIGIRKVLGSSAGDVVVLMAKEFVQLIIISFVVAVPLVSFLLNSWLENFTIHIELRAFTFVCAGLMVLGVACVVIVILTMRAALANPVQSLRSE